MLHLNKSVVSITVFILLIFALPACSTMTAIDRDEAALQKLLSQSEMTEDNRRLLTQTSTLEAEKFLSEGRVKSALKSANLALRFDPRDTEAKYVAGKSELANGNYQAALSYFLDLTESDPEGEALQFLGISQYFLNDEDAAYKSFQNAIQLDPSLWRALALQGRIENSKGRYEKADLYLSDALLKSSSPAAVYEHMGQAHVERGNWSEALNAFESAQSLSAKSVGKHDQHRLALAKQGQIRTVLRTASSDEIGRLYRKLGELALINGNKVEALDNLKKAKSHFSRYDLETDKLLKNAIDLEN